MAPSAIETSLGEHELTAAAALLRDQDPLSHALRLGNLISVKDIAQFHRATPPDPESTAGSSSLPYVSSHGESTGTKPTSATSYPAIGHQDSGKHRMKAGYASSLSGTYGSASEAEVERTALRRNNLVAMGDWADAELGMVAPLKGKARAKDRRHTRRRSGHKKPIVIIEQEVFPATNGPDMPTPEHHALTAPSLPTYGSIDSRSVCTRSASRGNDTSYSIEEGPAVLPALHEPHYQPLTPTRKSIIVGLMLLKVFILVIAAYGAYLTGSKRLPCTKGILFAATSSMAIMTVFAMLAGKRSLAEALLAGLVEFVFGFALVVEIDDFM